MAPGIRLAIFALSFAALIVRADDTLPLAPLLSIEEMPPTSSLARIPFMWASSKTTASIPLFLQTTADSLLVHDCFGVFRTVSGQLAAGVTAELVPVTSQDKPGKLLLRKGSALAATLTVTAAESITARGFQGELWGFVGDVPAPRRLALLEIAPSSAVAWSESDSGKIALTTDRAAFEHEFLLANSLPQPCPDVQVELPRFTDDTGHPLETTWTVQGKEIAAPDVTTLSLPPSSSVPLRVHAKLFAEGSYKLPLAVLLDGVRTLTQVSAKRTLYDAQLKLLGLGTVTASTPPIFGGDVDLRIYLQESSRREVTISTLALDQLVLTNPRGEGTVAQFNRVFLHTESGSDPIPIPVTLQPLEGKVIVMRVEKLQDPGKYTGHVHLETPDAKPADADFTLFVKRPFWWAGIWIALGVVTSVGLRHLIQTVRPHLAQKRAAALLVQDAENLRASLGALTARELEVWQQWQNRLAALSRDLDKGAVTTAEATLALLNRQLTIFPLWATAQRRLDAAGDLLGSKRQSIQDIAEAAQGYLIKSTEQSADFDNQRDALDQFAMKFEAAVIAGLQEQRNKLLDEARSQRAALNTNEARIALDKVILAATTVPAGGLAEQSRQLQELKRELVRVLSNDLLSYLAGAEMPRWFDAQAWQTMKGAVTHLAEDAERQAILDPVAAMQTYRQALERYLRDSCEALKSSLPEWDNNAAQSQDPIKTALKEILARVREHLTAAEQQLRSQTLDLAVAKKEFQDARDAASELVPTASGAPQGGGLRAAAAAVASTLGGLLEIVHAPQVAAVAPLRGRPIRSLPRVAALQWKLISLQTLIGLILLSIAVTVGLKLLWADDPTWGGWLSCATALLWGLGVHQISATGFDGLSKLAEDFSK